MTCTYPAAACPGPALHTTTATALGSGSGIHATVTSALPFTGANIGLLFFVGCVLVAVGAIAWMVSRVHKLS